MPIVIDPTEPIEAQTSVLLENTRWPDGTTVYAYDATGYTSGFPGANPPGTPVDEATAEDFSVEFTKVTSNVPYVAAGKVNGEWVYRNFIPNAEDPASLHPDQGPRGETGRGLDGKDGEPGPEPENAALLDAVNTFTKNQNFKGESLNVWGDESGLYLLNSAGEARALLLAEVGHIRLASFFGDLKLESASGNINATSHRITNVANPTSAQDAATKAYVDGADEALVLTAEVGTAPKAGVCRLTRSEAGTLKKLNVGTTNQIVVLHVTGAVTLTVKDGENLKLAGEATLGENDTLTLICDGTGWIEMARSNN